MTPEEIQRSIDFYKSQITIIWVGGLISLLILSFGLYNSIFVAISMLTMAITFWICDRREIKFKRNETKNRKNR